MRMLLTQTALLFLAGPVLAAPPAPGETPSADELASIMKTLLVTALPTPLVSQDFNWGHQKEVFNGVTWKGDGILKHPVKQEKLKNDGIWRKIRIEAVDADKNLTLLVKNVQKPEKGKLTFDMIVTMPTKIQFQQQLWKDGVRLYSGETRARCRPILILKCESTTKVQKSGSFIPDVIFRMHVLDAKLTYDDFKVEHTAGVGGDIAKVLGDAVHETIKFWRPSLEKDMLEKANKAIVKAGDTKEVKLGLGKLLDGK
ncbi:MAG TPA: hypothetical protein VHR66_13785 [Gemmataceae bacterium]|jgi:hypothetical protein|nr:hypothetical protein [Gemmataceae bacterium]